MKKPDNKKQLQARNSVKVKASIKAGSNARNICLENAGDNLMQKEQCYAAFGFPY